MFLRLILFLVLSIGFGFISYQAQAMTPEQYCKIHDDSGAPGSCKPRGDCAVITTNLGTEECKKCSDGGCTLTNCKNCPEQ